jgi:TM2 domain-containing membrane protein YozV
MRSPVIPAPPAKPGYHGMPIAPPPHPVPPRPVARYVPPSHRTAAIPVSSPGARPLSPIPYPGLPASAPPVAAYPFDDEQMSDRSGAVAGVLQLLLGWVGAGRLYTGHVAVALMQLGVVWTVVLSTMCLGVGASQAWVLTMLGLTWPVVDGVIFMCGGQRDSQGRRLR